MKGYHTLPRSDKEKLIAILLTAGRITAEVLGHELVVSVIAATAKSMFLEKEDQDELIGDALLRSLNGHAGCVILIKIYPERESSHKKHMVHACLKNFLNLQPDEIDELVTDLIVRNIPVLIRPEDFEVQDFPRMRDDFCYCLRGIVEVIC